MLTSGEKRRIREELAFRDAMMRGPEVPKSGRIVRTLNSPAFLWLVSALLLSVGGSFYTTQQQCYREADQLITQYDRLGAEIIGRKRQLYESIMKANSIEEVARADRLRTPQAQYIYVDFKDRGLSDLSAEYERLRGKFKFEFDPDRVLGGRIWQALDSLDDAIANLAGSASNTTLLKEDLSRITDLKATQKAALSASVHLDTDERRRTRSQRAPACEITAVFRRMTSGRTWPLARIVVYTGKDESPIEVIQSDGL